MSSNDFQKLNGLIAKLTLAANKGMIVDKSFKKHHEKTISNLKEMPEMLNRIEHGLKVAKIIRS